MFQILNLTCLPFQMNVIVCFKYNWESWNQYCRAAKLVKADTTEYKMLSSNEDETDANIDDLWAYDRNQEEKDEGKVCKKIKKKLSTM